MATQAQIDELTVKIEALRKANREAYSLAITLELPEVRRQLHANYTEILAMESLVKHVDPAVVGVR